MNEINLNGLGGPLGVGRSPKAVGSQKIANAQNPSAKADSAEFSQIPDLSRIEKAVEDDFASLRTRLEGTADTELYPPLETLDKLAAMLAIDLNRDQGK